MPTDPIAPRAPGLLASGQVYSEAYNFLSSIEAGVDPRTGLFGASVSLPFGGANDLRGPAESLNVGFSALNSTDHGFGQGWALNSTFWDGAAGQLQLASGARYRGKIVGSLMEFPDVRLPSVQVLVQRQEMWVRHLDGSSERLVPLAGHPSLWMPSTLAAPDGCALQLHWRAFDGAAYLDNVTDASGRVVLTITYGTPTGVPTRVTAQPGTPAEATLLFERFDGELRRVSVAQQLGIAWQFSYVRDSVTGLLLLKRCTQPGGSYEDVDHDQANGLQMPSGAPFARMPVVYQSTTSAGAGQPLLFTRYTYDLHGNSNYFGWPAVTQWRDYEDNLYALTGAAQFQYGSTQTLMDERGAVLLTTQRSFNRFHLMTRESTRQGRALVETITEYHDEPWLPIAQQVPYFQFPHIVTTRKAHLDENGGITRELVTWEQRRYDDHGNCTWWRDAMGGIEVSDYYPVSGDGADCPPDPLNAVARLKSQTASPPQGTVGPVKRTAYRYYSLPVRSDAPDFVLPVFIQRFAQTLHSVEGDHLTLLADTRFTHINDPDSPHHGSLLEDTLTRDGLPTVTAYAYALTQAPDARQLAQDVLHTTATVTGHDGTRSISRSARALYSAQTVSEQNAEGVTVAYAYDALQRRVLEVIAGGTGFEARSTLAYHFAPDQTRVTRTGPTGRKATEWQDNLGRSVRREVEDDAGNVYTAWTGEYNLLGQAVSETAYDPGNDEAPALALTTTRTFDDWGNTLSETLPDGVVNHSLVDPVALTTAQWATSADGEEGPRTLTTLSFSGQPLTQALFTPAGVLHRSLSWAYDGAGRCISQRDALNQETVQHWDALDRLVLTELPDGARLYRTYAPVHQTLPATVSLEHPSLGSAPVLLGTRRYDGLGRLLEETAGSATTQWRYQGDGAAAHTQVLADGTEVVAERIAELGDVLASVQAPGIGMHYDYDPITGRPTQSTGAQGHSTRRWSPAGHLAQVDYAWLGDQARTQQSRVTPGQRATWQCDADGSEQRFQYDALGRLSEKHGPDVQVTLTYDGFSRLATQTTRAGDGSGEMTLTVAHDPLGQPVWRETSVLAGAQRHLLVQNQQWRVDGKLSLNALTRDGALLRSESYEYDVRGRVHRHAIEGPDLPHDAQGHPYREQQFTYDALDNIRRLDTLLRDGSRNVTTFDYAADDPTQLIQVSHSHADYPAPVTLSYDALGNLVSDERGNPLHYDTLGRLVAVTLPGGDHRWYYGPDGTVVMTRGRDGPRWRYRLGGQLSCELSDSEQTRWAHVGAAPVAQSRLALAVREVMLLGTDAQGSVACEADQTLRNPAYSAYGASPDAPGQARLGYTGALREADVGWYLLGDYRAYNPALMRFHSRDSLSPFEAGGLNGYAYCAGDPVNFIDPTGHFKWWQWALAAVSTVISVAVTVYSLGTLAHTAIGLNAAFIGAVFSASMATASMVASVVEVGYMAAGDEKAASIAGWVSLGTGVLSGAQGMAKGAAAGVKGVAKGLKALSSLYDDVVELGFDGVQQFWKGVDKIQHAGGVPTLGAQAFAAAPTEDILRARLRGIDRAVFPTTFRELPDLPFREIVSYLPGTDLVNLSQVSSEMHGRVLAQVRTLRLPPFSETSVATNRPFIEQIRSVWRGETLGVLPRQLTDAGINPTTGSLAFGTGQPRGYVNFADLAADNAYQSAVRVSREAAEFREEAMRLRNIRLE